MAKKIQLLPPELTNQIAAGEVVERPASVVKELVENALDAHATEIVVTMENGGQSLISVQDNGMGIAEEELELAVTRHATSKLYDIAGLSQIHSYGFRGEALPSIASVSSFNIVSRYRGEIASPELGAEVESASEQVLAPELRQEKKEENKNVQIVSQNNENMGAELRVEFGKVQSLVPSAWQKGTLIEVRDLFFNIPARLKFLKSPATELKKSTDLFVRLALVAKNASLSLYAGTRLVHSFTKKESTKERLAHIWPPTIVEALLPVNYSSAGIRVTGYISHPGSHQPRADRMLYYVNGRAVSDKILMRATRQAFQGKLTTRDYPQCFLCVDLAPEEVDVNVHPAKNEVRFRDEQTVFVTILRAITTSLEKDTSNFSAKSLMHNEDFLHENKEPFKESFVDRFSSPDLHSEQIRQERLHEPMQQARLGDLYQPKPQGFWGDMDKETSLSFMKEEAERKRAQSTSDEWRVVHENNIHDEEIHPKEICNKELHEEETCNETIYEEERQNKINETIYKEGRQNKIAEAEHRGSQKSFQEPITPIEQLPENFNGYAENTSSDRINTQILHAKKASVSLPAGLVYMGQIAKTYLVLQKCDQSFNADSLILLDQHAVHERILYEEAKNGIVNAQNLLVPLEFPLHASEQKHLADKIPQLEKLAFSMEVRQNSCKVLTIPATLTRVEATAFLKDVLAQKTDDLEKIWISHACKQALKANTELDTQSALKLILRWLETEEPDYCPHGRPCVLHFDAVKLEQMFKR